MLLTSQNRESVIQTSAANSRGMVLAAAVAHRTPVSKRRFLGMRRTRRTLGMAMRGYDPAHCPELGDGQPPVGRGVGQQLHPRLWASLVLSRICCG
jgi:hypothetical protein